MDRPAVKNVQSCRMKLTELYAVWLTQPDTEAFVLAAVGDALRAARAPPATAQPNVGAVDAGPKSTPPAAAAEPPQPTRTPPEAGHRHLVPLDIHALPPNQSPPPKSPKEPKDKRDSSITPPRQSPTNFALGNADEVAMAHHRAQSPGAASPISPDRLHPTPDTPAHLPHPTHTPVMQQLVPPTSTPVVSPVAASTPATRQLSVDSQSRAPNSAVSSPASARQPTKVASLVDIPQFYFGGGQGNSRSDTELSALGNLFASTAPRPKGARGGPSIDRSKVLRRAQFKKVARDVFGVPEWLHALAFRRVLGACGKGHLDTSSSGVTYDEVFGYYDKHLSTITHNRRLFEVARQDPRRSYLSVEDLVQVARQLIEFHPGLTFLTQPEFQDLYCKTVTNRILFAMESKHNRRVSWAAFNNSVLADVMRSLDEIADINQELQFFSYEHFYVLYCKFWELDTDKDQLISYNDLVQYGERSITPAVIDRVMGGYGRKHSCHVPKRMNFEDFTYFCLSEEDKNSPQAVAYWFRILDTDGDGLLSGYELAPFFTEQKARFEAAGFGDEIKVEDVLCQLCDMLRMPANTKFFTLSDLKKCSTVAVFFNFIFNTRKFLGYEQRDPFQVFLEKQNPEKTDWDRFARDEYDRMAAESTD